MHVASNPQACTAHEAYGAWYMIYAWHMACGLGPSAANVPCLLSRTGELLSQAAAAAAAAPCSISGEA